MMVNWEVGNDRCRVTVAMMSMVSWRGGQRHQGRSRTEQVRGLRC